MISNDLGKTIKLDIESINYEGMGIAHFNDKVIFVERALDNETVNAKIDFENKSFYRAHATNILSSSKDRITPPCNSYPLCGGCQLLHMNYQKTLKTKIDGVNQTLSRIGHIDYKVNEIIGMDNPFPYRNKVQIPITSKKDKIILGYYKEGTHDVIPFDNCLLQSDKINELVHFLKNILNEYKVIPYNEDTKTGSLKHILIRENNKGELMLVFISNEKEIKGLEEIKDMIIKRYDYVKSIIINYNFKKNNVILGDESKVLYGKDEIIDEILGLKFKISHYSFFQVNRTQTEKLYSKVLEYVGKNGNVIDAYCGVGSITLQLSKNSSFVYGIEIVPQAIENAKENQILNNIENVSFKVGKVEDEILSILDEESIDCVVIDPPRKGLDIKVIEAIKKAEIEKIVYVSCNPSTLARDLDLLKDEYEIKGMCLVDMFSYTTGVETVCKLERKKV